MVAQITNALRDSYTKPKNFESCDQMIDDRLDRSFIDPVAAANLRDELKEQGWIVEDTKYGQKLKRD